jgi:hypothetical protein
MKKSLDSKLRLARETVRELTGDALADIRGGGNYQPATGTAPIARSFGPNVTAPCIHASMAIGPVAATPCRAVSFGLTITAPCRATI